MNHDFEEPRIYWCRESRTWKTDHAVVWLDRESGEKVTVPAHFETDLASVPFWIRPIVSQSGNWNRAAILHDYLYERKGVVCSGRKLTRKQSDRIFLNVAILDGTNPFVAFVGYYGIRINPANLWPFKKW